MAEKAFSVVRNPNFRKHYATNVLVYPSDVDFRVELMNEKFEAKKESEEEEEETIDEYVSDALVTLTPEATKKLVLRLEEAIDSYEEKFGEIKISPEREYP